MLRSVKAVKSEAHDALEAEAQGRNDSKSQGGYVDD